MSGEKIKIEELSILIFVEDVPEEDWSWRENESEVQRWLNLNRILAQAENHVDNMVEVRWDHNVSSAKLLRVCDLALTSKLFVDVKIGLNLNRFLKVDDFESNLFMLDREIFDQHKSSIIQYNWHEEDEDTLKNILSQSRMF